MTKGRFYILFILMICGCLPAAAQFGSTQNNAMNNNRLGQNGLRQETDSLSESHVDAKTVPHSVRAWHIDTRFGEIIPADVDTLHLNFQNANENYGMNGEYNMLGNLSSPRLSRIFMNRQTASESFFLDPLDFNLRTPQNHLFYNTKSPFTNLTYFTA
ncbi:MAG: hypothetical protein HUJ98_14565, partial [Bacteroidaceae bacterium]|nr:hypothetical protein [Bacteroidaceae bacterium]